MDIKYFVRDLIEDRKDQDGYKELAEPSTEEELLPVIESTVMDYISLNFDMICELAILRYQNLQELEPKEETAIKEIIDNIPEDSDAQDTLDILRKMAELN